MSGTSKHEYDAIVVGGGHNGLTNAAYLAKAGLRTLVLDRPVEEAFELVEEAVKRLRWRVIAEEPPMPPTGGRPA